MAKLVYIDRSWYYRYTYTYFLFDADPVKQIVYTCAAEVAYFNTLGDNE